MKGCIFFFLCSLLTSYHTVSINIVLRCLVLYFAFAPLSLRQAWCRPSLDSRRLKAASGVVIFRGCLVLRSVAAPLGLATQSGLKWKVQPFILTVWFVSLVLLPMTEMPRATALMLVILAQSPFGLPMHEVRTASFSTPGPIRTSGALHQLAKLGHVPSWKHES